MIAAALVAATVLAGGPLPPGRRLALLQSAGVGERPGARVAAAGRRALAGLVARLPSQRTRLERQTADAVVELLGSLSVELLAGSPSGIALLRVAEDVTDPVLDQRLEPVRAAARAGADLAPAIAGAAGAPGCTALRWVAAAWRVTESAGSGLAVVLDRVAWAARAEAEHRREVDAQLAAPRATARLLAALPVLGLGLGQLLGADPLAVLLGSPAGWSCLAAGLALELAGLRWTDRLARGAAG